MRFRAFIAILMLVTLTASQAAMAQDASIEPINVDHVLSSPDSQSGADTIAPNPTQLTPLVPQPDLGDKPAQGVDIVDESLKFHTKHDTSSSTINQNQKTSQTGISGNRFAGTTTFNKMQAMNGMNRMGMNQMGMNQMGLNQMGMNQMGMNQMGMNQMGMNSMGMGMMPMYQQNLMYQQQLQRQQNAMTKRALGVVGATALMGAFVTNGGVGGLLKNMGWDNTRRIRGSTIGY